MNPTLFSSHTHDPSLVNIDMEGPGYDGDQNRDGLSEVDSSDSDSSDEDDGSPSQFESSWPGHSGSSIYEPNEGFEGFEAHAQAVIQVEDEPLSREVNAHEPASTAAPIPILPTLHHSANFHRPPSVEDARLAMKDINTLLHPPRSKGRGFKNTGLTAALEKRLTWMQCFLRAFTGGLSWSSAALQTAQFVGKGPYMSRKVREWSKAYIADRENLPVIKYGGAWTKSRIDDEDLKQELLLHLQMLGKYVTASAIVTFLARSDVQARYQLTKTVSLATAQRWMKRNTFIPEWYKLDPKTRKWSSVNPDEQEGGQEGEEGRRTVVWHHDESTFYAHDRRKTRWVPKGEKAVPQQKGEGASLMVADFVSADYGWLCSRDGKESARVLFRAGKGRDGYFTNDEIIAHAEKAMVILEKDYADEDHIFIFDNATTHLKRADDALSACHMPKSCRAWGVERNKKDAEGKAVYSADGKLAKEKIPMKNGTFVDGSPQNFYYPPDHLSAGLFNLGMAKVLEERGFTVSGLKAQCGKNFDCAPGATDCCCRRTLYNQPDFVNVESLLEETCRKRGFQVLFLPKFHCELNFIEQCWGYAKRLYRCYPTSSKEADLERNVISALDAVPLMTMRRGRVRESPTISRSVFTNNTNFFTSLLYLLYVILQPAPSFSSCNQNFRPAPSPTWKKT
ncbi:hypothetical protein PAXINDRAFT_155912 [Paxillus involutus ATCC 200175]|uniref:Uncharacterized protein n=1 Tax=Paxillus involutus ATCC 200175 TaxID=664439 RepID=A0A0C9TGI7_PAXIN|nr:hypothetical protein PAXINDRAFT_155912 [Paxillus involutus ATCC 200175]